MTYENWRALLPHVKGWSSMAEILKKQRRRHRSELSRKDWLELELSRAWVMFPGCTALAVVGPLPPAGEDRRQVDLDKKRKG